MTDNPNPGESVIVRVGPVKQRAVMLELDGYQIEFPHNPFEVWAVIVARGETEAIIESLHPTEARAVDRARDLEIETRRSIQ